MTESIFPVHAPYRVCSHCGHIYPSAADLARDYNAKVDALNARVHLGMPPARHIWRADEITYCQECLHGF